MIRIKNKTFHISRSKSQEIFYQQSKQKFGYISGSQTYFSQKKYNNCIKSEFQIWVLECNGKLLIFLDPSFRVSPAKAGSGSPLHKYCFFTGIKLKTSDLKIFMYSFLFCKLTL